ncbi:MAG: NADH-quinone oxidoreductase subunit C [Verrucomicrobia bacterium]|nr:NADH-quinone oxidoreductase subunit C [Verrucomicrobiota bacterium]
MSNESSPPQPAQPTPATPAPAKPAAPAAAPAPAAPASAKPVPPPPPPPDPKIIALRDELQKVLGTGATWELNGKLPAFRVPAANIHAFAQKLKEVGFDYCLLVTATDFIKENRFEMVYALTNFTDGREVALVTDIPRAEAAIDTVSDLWPTAEWHEREVFDLFGIKFNKHQDLRRILLDDTWTGHPLRKDYADDLHQMVKRPY